MTPTKTSWGVVGNEENLSLSEENELQYFSSQFSHWRYVVLVSQEIVKVNNIFNTPFSHRYCKICHLKVSFIIPTRALISIPSGHAVVSLVLFDSIKSINKQTNEKGFYETLI